MALHAAEMKALEAAAAAQHAPKFSFRFLGDPALVSPCKRLFDASDIPHGLLDAMRREMKTTWAQALGLSANQVGASVQLAIARFADPSGERTKGKPAERKEVLLINPRLVDASPELVMMVEGCLSVPNIRNSVRRHSWVDLAYFDEGFTPHLLHLEGLDAQIAQHELDHLAGKTIVDHVSRQVRRQAERHAAKFAQQQRSKRGAR